MPGQIEERLQVALGYGKHGQRSPDVQGCQRIIYLSLQQEALRFRHVNDGSQSRLEAGAGLHFTFLGGLQFDWSVLRDAARALQARLSLRQFAGEILQSQVAKSLVASPVC